METQNISAQIFTKQLPNDKRASYYGCKNDMLTDHLTTCVDYVDTDRNIENAFQEQLDLSDYYKSPSIYRKMKKTFQDQTMEGMNATEEQRFPPRPPVKGNSETPIVPVGPRDKLFSGLKSKEFFGSSGKRDNKIFKLIMVAILILVVLLFLIRIK